MDVREFGAKGDGTTDDYAALQRAIDETTGLIEFASGTYRISKGLTVDLSKRGKTEIVGNCARIVNESNAPAFHFIGTHTKTADPDTIPPRVWEMESTPIIRGIEILAANPNADGILLEFTWQPIITHVSIHDCRHGVRLTRNNRNVIISNSHIYHNRGAGIFFDDVNLHQSIINTNHISYNAGGGIKVLHGNIRNIQICGNDIEYNFDRDDPDRAAADVWFVAGEWAIREGTIVGNTIQAIRTNGGANVRIEGFGQEGNRKAGLLNISGNLITNQEYNILILDSRGIAIQGNTFIAGVRRNIRVERSAYIAIGANVVDNNPDYRREPTGGIEFHQCEHCSVSGLILNNVGGEGAIELEESAFINITGCCVSRPPKVGIVFRASCDSRVSDCIIEGAESAVLEDGSCARNMFISNRVMGGTLNCHGEGTVMEGNLTVRANQ